MTVVAAISVIQWADAVVAATLIDDRPWLAHLIERLRRAACVSRVVVVCHPACVALVTPLVPAGVGLETSADPWTWGAHEHADLIARCRVTQLFADPAHLDRLATLPRAPQAQRVHAALPRCEDVDLTGGAYVDLLTPDGCAAAANGVAWARGATLAVPSDPEPPELWLRSAADAGWGVTLQRALLAHGTAGDLSAVDAVLTAERLRRFNFWPDGVGRGPARVLTMRCQPAPLFARLLRHLAHLPASTIDVVCPAVLAADTAAMAGVAGVMPFEGSTFDLDGAGEAWLAAVRARRYDLCLVPRRTADGHGFANVTAFGTASGATVAAWIDLHGQTGLLSGVPCGWEPWVTAAPPWHDVAGLRGRAAQALRVFTTTADDTTGAGAEAAAARTSAARIVACLDEYLACQALIDNPDAGLELAPLLLHQAPPVIATHAAVARLRAAARPVAPRAAAVVERMLAHGVQLLCDAVPGDAGRARTELARRAAEAMSALTARLEAAGDGSDDEVETLALCEQLARDVAHAAAAGRAATLPAGRA